MNFWTAVVLVPAAVCVLALVPEVGRWLAAWRARRRAEPMGTCAACGATVYRKPGPRHHCNAY